MTHRTLSSTLVPILGLAAAPLAFSVDSKPDLPASRTLSVCPVSAPAGQITSFAAGETAPEAEGTAASASGQVITATAAIPGSFDGTHYVRINGAMLPVVSVAGAAITIDGILPAVAPGDAIEIVPLPTLDIVFGSSNRLGLVANASPSLADNVFTVVDGVTRTFYFRPLFGGGGRWDEVGGATDVGSSVFFEPNAGFWIVRVAGNDAVLPSGTILSGEGDRVLQIDDGLGFYAWPFQESVTLAESGLGDVLTSNASPSLADSVFLEVGGAIREFYFRPLFGGGGRWDEVGGATDVGSSVSLGKGKAFLINRVGSGSVTLTVSAL